MIMSTCFPSSIKEKPKAFCYGWYIINEQETIVVNDNLTRLEKEKLGKIGNSREYYEKLIDNIDLN